MKYINYSDRKISLKLKLFFFPMMDIQGRCWGKLSDGIFYVFGPKSEDKV